MASMPEFAEVDHLLVTENNPATSSENLDFERCAALHNFLIRYAWIANGRSLDDFQPTTIFDQYGDEAEEIRNVLSPDLISFLETAYDIEYPPLFFWVSGFTPPTDMFVNRIEREEEEDRFFTLYSTNVNMGEHPDGLVYDQIKNQATMALGIEDHDYTMPPEDHEELWHPLETVLSQWIEMVKIGKITAFRTPEGEEEQVTTEAEYLPWRWNSYSEKQVESTLTAFDSLVHAIESRMPDSTNQPPPPFTPAELSEASIPSPSFIHSFLLKMRVPSFRYIAPGLLIPQHDHQTFMLTQSFTQIDTSGEDVPEMPNPVIPPVLLFRAWDSRTINFDTDNQYRSLNPFCQPYTHAIKKGDHSIPAGLYSESVRRFDFDNAEEGFRLLLPFPINSGNEDEVPGGARKSDGTMIEEGSIADLFQHGFQPFGGERRAQRMERLFVNWTDLIERGIWIIGEEGVTGDIETFREAEGHRWRDYVVEPSW